MTSSSYSPYFTSDDLTSSSQHTYQRWSEQEDSLLYNAVMDTSGGISPIRWKRISLEYFLGLRSESQCRYRWNRVIHPGLQKDVTMMKDDVDTNNHVCVVLQSHDKRKVLRQKKMPWTKEDKMMLLQLVQQYGRLWNYIATYYFPGRFDGTSCQTMWYNLRQSEQRRRKRQLKQEEIMTTMTMTHVRKEKNQEISIQQHD
jgi:Myb-like DNA-binding domain